MTIRHAVIKTTLGELTVAAAGDAVTGIYFPGHWYLPPAGMLGERVDAEGDAVLTRARMQLELRGYAGGLERKQTLLDLEEPAEVSAGKLF